jgi:DNA-binding transcriptional regulator YhcF (GntR family)
MTYEQLRAEEAKILAELEEIGYVESWDQPGKFVKRAVDQSRLQMTEDPIEVMFQTMDVDK